MGLILRKLIGFGTARGLQGLRGVFGRAFSALERTLRAEFAPMVELMKFGPRAGSWLPILRSNCELIRYAA
ncbi:MAG: hypothetical protein IPK83_02500 [Planctomycetes bacterium]|nr:hypothetical protein [Planctomycetota bacterium]